MIKVSAQRSAMRRMALTKAAAMSAGGVRGMLPQGLQGGVRGMLGLTRR